MNNPLISVVIPTYNRGAVLLEAIKSVLNQTYKNIEVVVISDASTDNTIELVKNIKDERLVFHQLDKNLRYPGRVRNVGIKLAKGEFIAFCDDDDLWHKSKLALQIGYLLRNPQLNAIASNGRFFPGYGIKLFNFFKDKKVSYREMFKTNFIITSSVLLNRRILEEVGVFDEDERLMIAEDRDLWLRILRKDDLSILILKKVLIKYRLGNIKILTSYNNNAEAYFDRLLYIYRKHLPYSQDLIDDLLEKKISAQNYIKRQILSNMTKALYAKQLGVKSFFLSTNISVREKAITYIKFLYKIGVGLIP